MTAKIGRPTKLTDAVLAAIVADIRAGMPEGAAGARQRIAPSTFREWMKRGKDDIAADEDSAFADAYLEVEGARADLVAERVKQLNAAIAAGGKDADGTVRSILTYLAMRWPDEWSERRVLQKIDQTTRTVDGAGGTRTVEEIDAELDAVIEARGLRLVPLDDAPASDEAAA